MSFHVYAVTQSVSNDHVPGLLDVDRNLDHMGPTKTFKNGPIARSVSFDNKSSIVNSTSQGKTEAVYGRQTARAALETSGKLTSLQ